MDPTTQRLMMGSDNKQPFFGTLSFIGTTAFITTSLKMDSSGNAYICALSVGTPNKALLIKLKTGLSGASVEWTRSISTAGDESYYDVAISDDGASIYVVGSVSGYSGIAKYNSSGTIQWVRYLTTGNASFGVTVDSSGDVYITGYSIRSGQTTNDAIIAKYNSSGTIQWQKFIGGVNDEYGYSIAPVPSSGGFVITGISNQQSNLVPQIFVAKFNTSGSLSWQKQIGVFSANQAGNDIGIDSSGNIYVVGYTDGQGAGSSDIYLVKLDTTNGNITWQRSLGGVSSEQGERIHVDPSTGDCYIVGDALNLIIVAKYNTSGTLQWQRSMALSGGINAQGVTGVSLGPDKMLYVLFGSGSSGATTNFFVRIDPNGNGTGTFGVVTYSTTSYTDSARTLSIVNLNQGTANTSFTDADGSGLITEGSESLNFDGA